MLRYKSQGEVHKDFHGLACATLHYLIDNYGQDAMTEVISRTAREVYKTIHEKLKNGDTSELTEYWEYYFQRENGDFSLESIEDGVRLIVKNCPALSHLRTLNWEPDPILCEATAVFNQALAEDTPFAAETVRTGTFSCIQTFRKKEIV